MAAWPFPEAGTVSAGTGSSKIILVVEDLGQQHLPARSMAAVLRRAGWDARLVDFSRGPDGAGGDAGAAAIIALAGKLRPRLIIFSVLFADRVPEHLALIAALRRAGVHAHLTLAGPLPSFAPAELLAACPGLDSVLCGEAEASIAALAAGLDDPALRRDVPGLAYNEAGFFGVRANPWSVAIAGLDDLPRPQRDAAATSFQGYGFATVQSSRGCYHACAMCLPCAFYRAVPGGRYRLRGISHLADEIEALYRRGTRLFLFDDEQFLPPGDERQARVEAFAQELARRELKIAFTIKCRPDDVEPGILGRLQEIGLLRVYVGIESGCQATLDLLGKGVTVQRNSEALATLDRLGLIADFYCLMFHPWSTLGTIRAELAFLEQIIRQYATVCSFSEIAVYPGTSLARRLQGEGRGGGLPWPLAYEITDPRAELLRRLNTLIFGASSAHDRMRDRITQVWFALLLARRFRPERFAKEQADQLRSLVRRLNHETVEVWQEMAEFARQEDIHDARWVNTRAGEWAGAVRGACLRAEDALSALMPDHVW
jgi:anaerobic magnesium-protoporphyrin IX monomethyl ester cyclase